jgi:hypothetical protein
MIERSKVSLRAARRTRRLQTRLAIVVGGIADGALLVGQLLVQAQGVGPIGKRLLALEPPE